MACLGTAASHCCWIEGEVCRFLTVEDDSISCSLRASLGSWASVYQSKEYKEHVRPTMSKLGVACGTWPGKGRRCATCGVIGG